VLALAAMAEMRPRYGDTLRIETRSAAFLTPSSYGADDTLSRLVFDTLTTVDANGTVEPAVATSWQSGNDNRRWQFWLRRNAVWHDGAPLIATDVAQIIGAANASWHVRPVGDSIVIETDQPEPGLAAEMALTHNALVKKLSDGTTVGSGPYKLVSTTNGRVVLKVNDDYWRGRAFADGVEITPGRSLRDQALDVDLGRADIVEASVEDLRRAASPRTRFLGSRPIEVMALVFSPKRSVDDRVREAIALSLDRNAIQSVLLQRQGEASASLLPNWMTGYALAFSPAQDLARARQLKNESGSRVTIGIGYSGADPLARVIAERVVLNARDAGFAAQLVTDVAAADVVVERITLRSADPWAALSQVANDYGIQVEFKGAVWQDLFNAEHDLLAKRVVVPIVHLPRVYAISNRARGVRVAPDGTIDLPLVWLTAPELKSAGVRQ
jgi:peptide/nickel transport system substrate-binding protein